MSQYRIVKNEKTFVYGFDRVVPEYFMSVETKGEDVEELVGCFAPESGTSGHLLKAISKHGIIDLIPEEHLANIMLDLPF
jgi:hypothetical protein